MLDDVKHFSIQVRNVAVHLLDSYLLVRLVDFDPIVVCRNDLIFDFFTDFVHLLNFFLILQFSLHLVELEKVHDVFFVEETVEKLRVVLPFNRAAIKNFLFRVNRTVWEIRINYEVNLLKPFGVYLLNRSGLASVILFVI